MLILTEKPSVAAAFAEALGVPRKGDRWENADHCIVNALGHLLEDFMPEDYDPALAKWALETLPIIPKAVRYKPIGKTAGQLAVVRECFASRGDEPFLLATDAEREGEIIGAEILDHVGFGGRDGARRFWVSEALTPEVIRAGIDGARPLSEYSSYREQGFARRHADWLVGMNLTRLVSLKCGRTLHVGRVQTAVLGAVRERDMAIEGFSRERYVEVTATLAGGNRFAVRLVNDDDDKFPSRFPPGSDLPSRVEAAGRDMTTAVVTEAARERRIEHPPKLYNLTVLQKEAHGKFSYTPERTLETAQALYEKHRCLSYPRTPSRVMGDGNVGLVGNVFDRLRAAFPDEAGGTDPGTISADNKRLFNSAELRDHHALIPLDAPPDGLSVEERNVYMLVLRGFFRILRPPHVYDSVRIKADISGFVFAGSGREILEDGWKAFAGADGDDDGEESGREDYTGVGPGNSYPVESVAAVERETEPMKRHTFASLLSLMENPRGGDGGRLVGLGTPATRGAILKKLVDRGYLTVRGKSVTLSGDGKFLMENIAANGKLAAFLSVRQTTEWEERLHSDTDAFLEGIRGFVRGAVADTEMGAYVHAKKSFGKCPLCGGDVLDGKKSYYCGNYNAREPCGFAVWKEICGAPVSEADVLALLSGKKTKVRKCKSLKSGREFRAALVLAGGKVEFVFEEGKK